MIKLEKNKTNSEGLRNKNNNNEWEKRHVTCDAKNTEQRSVLLNNEDTLLVIIKKLPFINCLNMRLVSQVCRKVATYALQDETMIRLTCDKIIENSGNKWKFVQENNLQSKIIVNCDEGSNEIENLTNFILNPENKSKLKHINVIRLIGGIDEQNVTGIQELLNTLPSLPALHTLYFSDLWSPITLPRLLFLEVVHFCWIASPLVIEDFENLHTFSCGNINAPLKLKNLSNLITLTFMRGLILAPVKLKNLPCLKSLSFNSRLAAPIIIDKENPLPCLELVSYKDGDNSSLKVLESLQKAIDARAVEEQNEL